MKMTDDMDEKEEIDWYRSQLRAQAVLRAATVNLGVRHAKEWTHKQMISHLRDQPVKFIEPSSSMGLGEKKKEREMRPNQTAAAAAVMVVEEEEEEEEAVPLDAPPVVVVEEKESKGEEDGTKGVADLGDEKRGGPKRSQSRRPPSPACASRPSNTRKQTSSSNSTVERSIPANV